MTFGLVAPEDMTTSDLRPLVLAAFDDEKAHVEETVVFEGGTSMPLPEACDLPRPVLRVDDERKELTDEETDWLEGKVKVESS